MKTSVLDILAAASIVAVGVLALGFFGTAGCVMAPMLIAPALWLKKRRKRRVARGFAVRTTAAGAAGQNNYL